MIPPRESEGCEAARVLFAAHERKIYLSRTATLREASSLLEHLRRGREAALLKVAQAKDLDDASMDRAMADAADHFDCARADACRMIAGALMMAELYHHVSPDAWRRARKKRRDCDG